MTIPVSQLDDSDMQAVPAALMRAAENARRLAEQTGTRFVVRPVTRTIEKSGRGGLTTNDHCRAGENRGQ
jgi:hypothetical protein